MALPSRDAATAGLDTAAAIDVPSADLSIPTGLAGAMPAPNPPGTLIPAGPDAGAADLAAADLATADLAAADLATADLAAADLATADLAAAAATTDPGDADVRDATADAAAAGDVTATSVTPSVDAAITNPTRCADGAPSGCDGAGSCVAGAAAAAVCQQPLIVDDFADQDLASNAMGGRVTSDNQRVSIVNGEARFVWDGRNRYQDFIETFRPNWCGFDLRGYRVLRFRMRASVPSKVRVLFGLGSSACTTVDNPVLKTVAVETTSTTFAVDISALARDKAIFVEWSPLALDATEYLLDDVHLLP